MDLQLLASSLASGARHLGSDPAAFMREQKAKATIKAAVTAIILLSLAGLFLNVCSILLSFVLQPASGGQQGPATGDLAALLIVYPLSFLVLSIFAAGVAYALMHLLGGKGKFTEVYYLMAVSYFPVSLLFSYLVWLLSMPLLPLLNLNPMDLASMAVLQVTLMVIESVVPLYILTFALREAGQFSTFRSLLCWLAPIGLLVGTYLMITVMTIQFMDEAGFAPADVSGFDGLMPQFALAYPINASDSQLLLMFSNPGSEFQVDGAAAQAAMDGRACAIRSVWLEDSAGKIEGPLIIRSYSSSTLAVGLSGQGCGGNTGESYNITLILPTSRPGQQSVLSGSIAGNFSSASMAGLNETAIKETANETAINETANDAAAP